MVALFGTVATICVADQLPIDIALAPLNVTVPLPCVDPKFVPVIVTDAPTGPDVVDRTVMLGAGTTVKADPLLATPLTVTVTLPVVAPVGTVAQILVDDQLAIDVAVVPLNITVPLLCVGPKFVPVIFTEAPTAPVVGDRLVMFGCASKLPAQART